MLSRSESQTRANPRTAAREMANLSLAEVAKRTGLSLSYLARIERLGDAPWHTANRLARIYGCGIDIFF